MPNLCGRSQHAVGGEMVSFIKFVFVPNNIYVDYLKAPMYIRLTQDQINSTLDYSQVLEFPDYVCFEIANIFVRLLMENVGDPRLQTNMPINNTIASPAAIQAAQQQAQ